MGANLYERSLLFDLLDDGVLEQVFVTYTHHYQRPDYNTYDSRDDYYGENHCEVIGVEFMGETVEGEWGELEQILLDEFVIKEGDYL